MDGALSAILNALRFFVQSFNNLDIQLFGTHLTFARFAIMLIVLSFLGFIIYGGDDEE